MVGQRFRALAAVSPVRAQERFRSHALSRLLDFGDFGIGIGDELVDGDDGRHTELIDVLDVALEVLTALGDGCGIFRLEIILGDAAMHLQCANGCNDDDG